jgi:hypothetical protein
VQVFEIPRRDVIAIRRKRFAFSRGFLIEHRTSDIPPFLCFWSLNPNRLSGALQSAGYGVEE